MIIVPPFDENNNEKFVSEFEVGSENYKELEKALISYIDFDKANSNAGLLKLSDLLKRILETNAKTFDGFTNDELKAEIKEIKTLITESHFSFETDRDDIVEVLPVSLENYIADFVEAIKYQKKLERAAEKEKVDGKHKVKSARQRALARESVATPNQVFDIIKATLVMCNEHIDQILHVEKFDSSIYVKEFIEFYKNAIFTKYNKVRKAEAKTRAIKLLGEVGIPEPARRYNQYPFEFSGGMRQRIVIAIALSSNPEILICDEPTTALDVTIQAQILELINKIKVEKNLSIIFITHDLGVVANMADDIAVMYAGKIVEYGSVEEIFYDPRHPYTWALLGSMPDLDTKQQLSAIPGTPPNMILPPKGDAFAIRNKYAMEIDFEEEPPLFKVSDTHFAATWLLHPSAPKVEMPAVVKERIERTKGDFKNGK
ncbi:MAG: ATP-binding cassette domain-containing protein [Bacilli bacterium]